MPYTTSVAGTTITASWANANVRDQVVTPFANYSTLTATVTAPVAGMVQVTNSDGTLWRYSGSAWVPVTPHVCTSASRPGSSLTGGIAVESDTTRQIMWDGSAWQRTGWYAAGGRTAYIAGISTAGSDATITTAVEKTVVMGTESQDTDSFATAGTSTSITIPASLGGLYAITVHVEQTAGGTGTNGYIKVIAGGTTYVAPAMSNQGTYDWSGVITLNAADTIQVRVYQDSGSTKTIGAPSKIFVVRLGV